MDGVAARAAAGAGDDDHHDDDDDRQEDAARGELEQAGPPIAAGRFRFVRDAFFSAFFPVALVVGSVYRSSVSFTCEIGAALRLTTVAVPAVLSRLRRSAGAAPPPRRRTRAAVGRADVAEQPGDVEQEADRHQDRVGHAPLADRFDVPDLQVGQVDAEAEAAEREQEAAEARVVVAEEHRAEDQDPADDPEDRDVDPEDVRVGAFRDGLAAGAPGQAGRRPRGLSRR